MYCVFDLETTGFEPKEHQIIEIGAVVLDSNFNIVDKFQTFIDLYKVLLIPNVISELTGITMNDIVDAPEIEDGMEDFFNFLEKNNVKYLVAQKAKFDMKFLYYTIIELGLEYDLDYYGAIDTIQLAKLLEKYNVMTFENYKLGTLAAMLNLDYDADAHHRADYDAELTSKVFHNQVKLLGDKYKLESLEKNRYIYSTLSEKNSQVDLHLKVKQELMIMEV